MTSAECALFAELGPRFAAGKSAHRTARIPSVWPPRVRSRAVAMNRMRKKNGGEGGIRTLGSLARTRAFQARAFDHSATSPGDRRAAFGAACRRTKGQRRA